MSFKLIIFYYYLKYKFFMKIDNKEKLLSFQKRKIKKHLEIGVKSIYICTTLKNGEAQKSLNIILIRDEKKLSKKY